MTNYGYLVNLFVINGEVNLSFDFATLWRKFYSYNKLFSLTNSILTSNEYSENFDNSYDRDDITYTWMSTFWQVFTYLIQHL